MKLKIGILTAMIVLIVLGIWRFDPFHKPVETVEDLIGRNYKYANDKYFGSEPNNLTSFNINGTLNEFQGGVLSKRKVLRDSIINQATWEFANYKVTIWFGKTNRNPNEIIDAIRYKNGVEF